MSDLKDNIVIIKQYIYGKQFQADRVNLAVAAFVYNTLYKQGETPDMKSFVTKLKELAKTDKEDEKTAVRCVLPDDVIENIKNGAEVIARSDNSTGRIIFMTKDPTVVTKTVTKDEKLEGKSTGNSLDDIMNELYPLATSAMKADFGDNKEALCLFVASYFYGGTSI